MKQGIFEVFSFGDLGLKANDLNRYSNLITGLDMIIPEGVVIATGIFDLLLERIDFEKPVEEIKKNACPIFLRPINENILDNLEIGVPYAIRSSALSERGGTGIYKTVFLVLTGNRETDLLNLWHCELLVYASEFTGDAKAWRAKDNAPIGMAILIQQVIGFNLDSNFLPPLSGTAYTSYNGLPTVRAVIGLGTKAVDGSGLIFNYSPEEWLHFQREMWDQEFADAISAESAISKINTHYEDIQSRVFYQFETFISLFDKLTELKKEGEFYLEWVIFENKIYIVQCASFEDRLPGDVTFNNTDYFLLLSGGDVLNSGNATCKCIVYAHEWTPDVSRSIEDLNRTNLDYLLVVPQDALSLVADINNPGQRLAFRHFSNALAVVEKQRTYSQNQVAMMLQLGKSLADHSFGTGASHFSQLCNRAKTLFIGGEFDETPLFTLPGGMSYRDNIGITIWNTTAEVVVNAVKKEGFVYISKKSKKNNYSLSEIKIWTNLLRQAASVLESEKSLMANDFYVIHYAIIPPMNLTEFDPLKVDQEIIEEFGGMPEIIRSLQFVITNGRTYIDFYTWSNGLKVYLEELLLSLTQSK
ncbi:MAG: PEP/pyruvate-binding domain-containing protein [Candidatus Falkowbacteria bacterium]